MYNKANIVNIINITKTVPISATLTYKTNRDMENDTETCSLSSCSITSTPEITFNIECVKYNQTFQVKHEGKYVDFIPYKISFRVLSPTVITRYENLPDKVFGKFEINDKYNTITVIYKTFKKKYIKVKKI